MRKAEKRQTEGKVQDKRKRQKRIRYENTEIKEYKFHLEKTKEGRKKRTEFRFVRYICAGEISRIARITQSKNLENLLLQTLLF